LARNEGRKLPDYNTRVMERDGEWFIAYCPEVPGANGQGRTVEECEQSLTAAIALIREDHPKGARD
jgi:predicted RNase H-like HicB family nuclease